jgi:hypothetical protein
MCLINLLAHFNGSSKIHSQHYLYEMVDFLVQLMSSLFLHQLLEISGLRSSGSSNAFGLDLNSLQQNHGINADQSASSIHHDKHVMNDRSSINSATQHPPDDTVHAGTALQLGMSLIWSCEFSHNHGFSKQYIVCVGDFTRQIRNVVLSRFFSVNLK